MIIMPTIFFIGLTNIMGIQILIPMGREKMVMYSTVVGAVIDTLINFLLIPHYGAAGAALGTLVAEIAVFIFQICLLDKQILMIFRHLHYPLFLISLPVCSVLSLWTKKAFSNSFIILLISFCIFFSIYTAFLYILKEPLFLELKNQIRQKLIRFRQ